MKAKLFDAEYGKVVKINIELEFYVDDDTTTITPKEVISMVQDMDRLEIGEILLNQLDKAVVL